MSLRVQTCILKCTLYGVCILKIGDKKEALENLHQK
jgi:hypothetical protein